MSKMTDREYGITKEFANKKCSVISPGSENHGAAIKAFGDFIEADSIEYDDLGNGEDYVIIKNGKRFLLSARSNKVDGGFISFRLL